MDHTATMRRMYDLLSAGVFDTMKLMQQLGVVPT
jgi:hypothetical protein